jgi:hypothetical protein
MARLCLISFHGFRTSAVAGIRAGLLAVGIAAVIGGSRSFAAIGQWAADAGPDVLAGLGAARGPAEESIFRRAFAMVSADRLDRSSAPGCGPGPWCGTY